MTWAPFSIVGEEIQRLSDGDHHSHPASSSNSMPYEPLAVAEEEGDSVELNVSRVSISSSSVPPFSAADLEAAASASAAGDSVSANELSGV